MPTKTFPVTGTAFLVARLGHGSLTVDTTDGLTEATVTLTARTPGSDIVERTAVEQRGSTIVVQAPRQGGLFDLFGGRKGDAMDVHVTLPAGSGLKIGSYTTNVTVSGRVGTSDLSFGVANAQIEDVDGDLRLRFGSGTVRTGHIRGSVELGSGAGDAVLASVGGSLNAGRGSGTLDVGEVHGSVRTRVGSGRAVLRSVHGDVDIASGSGPIEIGLPSGRPTRLDVTTGSGRLNSDLPIEETPAATADAITVRARTGSGDIHLFRAGA